MADRDPIEGQAAPIIAGNMTNAPAVVDPARRGGGKDRGASTAYGDAMPNGTSRKHNDDKIVQGADNPMQGDGSGNNDVSEMDDDTLLDMLHALEDDASQYATGPLRAARDSTVKAYFQRPYGNEDDGWSGYISAVVSETVEWMLPDLLDIFVSNDKAVEFEPTRADEEQNAKDATAAANHVFYQQNPGFLILHTAIKDMLLVKTCAIHWYKQTKRKRCRVPFRSATRLDLAALMKQYPGAQIDQATMSMAPIMAPAMPGQQPQPFVDPATGQPHMQEVWTGRLSYVEERKQVKVEAFEPENLGVMRSWTSPLLQDCPYVVRWIEISLSDLNELAKDMGFDEVTPEELAGSMVPFGAYDEAYRRDRTGDPVLSDMRPRPDGIDRDDPTATTGWLRVEWVLVDCDRDGIAERREIWRLHDKILYNEECEEVPVCTGSPILTPHRWDGQSVGETMEDLQLLDSELTRGVINNAYASNNPRKIVLTDANGASYADMEDLLDGRPGGMIRTKRQDAIGMEPTEYVGDKMEPLLARVDQLREQRSGVTKQRMGMDPNAIRTDRTLGEVEKTDNASKQRTKLVARIIAELVVAPMFQGILRLLTSGDFDPIFFKLRGHYVTLDPNEWRDHYAMTINVGLGTGDSDTKMAALGGIGQLQMQLAQSPIAKLTSPHQMYNAIARKVELSGFANVGEFFTEPPQDVPFPQAPNPPPPWQLQAKQMQLQADQSKQAADRQFETAKLQMEASAKAQAAADQNNVQMQNDERDAQREALEATSKDQLEALRVAIDKYKVDVDSATKIMVARLASQKDEDPADMDIDPRTGQPFTAGALSDVMGVLQQIYDAQNAPLTAVRDPQTGEVTHVQRGNGPQRPVIRDANGRVVGVQ
jgi:hypothetical protein